MAGLDIGIPGTAWAGQSGLLQAGSDPPLAFPTLGGCSTVVYTHTLSLPELAPRPGFSHTGVPCAFVLFFGLVAAGPASPGCLRPIGSRPAACPRETWSAWVCHSPCLPPRASPAHVSQPLQMAPCFFLMSRVPCGLASGRFNKREREALAKGDTGSL